MSVIEEAIQGVEREMLRLLSEQERPRVLVEAMRWAVEGGGKRIRPRICLAAAVAAGGSANDALLPACAVELLHSYTLVHDDLPAMDNDAERRGKPSVWAKFGEANAILAGDALQALAFTALVQTPERRPSARAPGTKDVPFIYEHKTADLFMAAAVTGALAGGGDDASVEKLRLYAYHLGLAFQYEDDLLDDDSPFSRDETLRLVQSETNAALAALSGLPGNATPLAELARVLVNRTR